jgi:anaerobic ribonucleoside-triphosphate reductase
MNSKRIEEIDNEIKAAEEKLNDPSLCLGTASTYSRVSGYYRSVSRWNNGKEQEFKDRETYSF